MRMNRGRRIPSQSSDNAESCLGYAVSCRSAFIGHSAKATPPFLVDASGVQSDFLSIRRLKLRLPTIVQLKYKYPCSSGKAEGLSNQMRLIWRRQRNKLRQLAMTEGLPPEGKRGSLGNSVAFGEMLTLARDYAAVVRLIHEDRLP